MDLIIVGTGGHSRVVADAALESGFQLIGFVDLSYKGSEEDILGFPVLGGRDVLDGFDSGQTLISVAVGNNCQRAECYFELKRLGFSFASIIHPTAVLSKHIEIGEGCFINSNVVVNAGVVIGNNCIVNTGSIIEHECMIGDSSHIGPGVRVGGRTSIGRNSFVGIGSSVIEYIDIGDDVIVGAGSVVINDIIEKTTVVGIPAKVIR